MEVTSVVATLARVRSIAQRVEPFASSFAPSFARVLAEAQARTAAPERIAGLILATGPGPVPAPPPPGAPWALGLPARGRRWAGAIEEVAARYGLDPRLLAALVWAESGFDPSVVSPAGAIGLTQLMPATAASLGVDPCDPLQNLEGGARYLRAQLDRFGRLDVALAAYNAGPGRVVEAGGIPQIPETRAYVARVLGLYRQLGGGA